jgi:hypothetical protein
LNFSEGNAVLNGVDQFHVTDRTWRLLYQTGHAFVSLAAQADGPLHRSAFADFVFPRIIDLRKEISPDKRGTAAIRTVYNYDISCRKFHARIGAGNFRVIPFSDCPKINTR